MDISNIENKETNITVNNNVNTQVTADDLLDELFPKYGSKPRVQAPIWDSSEMMFIFEQHHSPEGNLYYRGIRFSDRLAIVENIGLFHSWSYIDSIEVYNINGTELHFLQKKVYKNVFHDAEFIKSEVEKIVAEYVISENKRQNISVDNNTAMQLAKQLVAGCYNDFNKDGYAHEIMGLLPNIKSWNYANIITCIDSIDSDLL